MHNNFNLLADKEISYIYDQIDHIADQADIEIDLINGILYITILTNGQYVINKHGPTEQIWVSSPFSGAHHCYFDKEKEDWLSTKLIRLRDMLSLEFRDNLNIDLEL